MQKSASCVRNEFLIFSSGNSVPSLGSEEDVLFWLESINQTSFSVLLFQSYSVYGVFNHKNWRFWQRSHDSAYL